MPIHLVAAMLFASVQGASAGPIHDAAREGDAEAVAALIAEGVEVNERHRMLGWPLHQAALNDHVEMIAMLVAAGAEMNADRRTFGTPLYAAALKGHRPAAIALIDGGAELDVHGPDGGTPLHAAAAEGHTAMVDLLLSRGADPNALTDRSVVGEINAYMNYRPQHAAAANGHFDLARLLGFYGGLGRDVEPFGQRLETADAARGKVSFDGTVADIGDCWICHSAEDPKDPSCRGGFIGGVVGRAKGQSLGAVHSEAMQRAGGVWTPAELNAFQAAPSDYLPGTQMWHRGVKNVQDRADIIAYLATTKGE